jgi:hypothetical protein
MELGRIEERISDIRLNIRQPDGQVLRLGHHGPSIDWHIHNIHALYSINRHPQLNLGRSYVNGEWDVGEGFHTAILTNLARCRHW